MTSQNIPDFQPETTYSVNVNDPSKPSIRNRLHDTKHKNKQKKKKYIVKSFYSPLLQDLKLTIYSD